MSKRTLLLADDSVTIQKVVNLTFADEGIEVITVGDGDSAMQKISEVSPDVVLADVHMPGLSGYQICEILRDNPLTSKMPVVLLVGSFEPFDESEAARVGANAYLTKPFQSIRQLVSQVTELMDASQPAEESVPTEPESAEPTDLSLADETLATPPPTDDIESLYHQSFSDLASADAEAEPASSRFVDSGMDDEMIETSHVDSGQSDSYTSQADLAGYEPGVETPDDQVTEPAPEFADNSEANDLSEYTTAETYEHEASFAAPTSEFQYQESTQEVSADREPHLGDQVPEHHESRVDDSGRIGAAVAGATAEAFSEFDEFSRTEQMPAYGTPVGGSDLDLDDSELLELPPIENGKTVGFTTAPSPPVATEEKQIVSLSPELMDILVQKVVEKLSDKK